MRNAQFIYMRLMQTELACYKRSMPTPLSTSRIALLERSEVSPQASEIYDALIRRRGVVPNMFRVWAHAPALLSQVAPLSWALLDDGALSGRYKELVSIYVSRLAGCEYGCKAHEVQALRKGATAAEVAMLTAPDLGSEKSPFTPAERLGFAYADRIWLGAAAVDDDFFESLRPHFTEPQIVELTATVTALIFLTRFIDTLRIPTTRLPPA
jgi:AhpD family alkylhydroperoxidase